MKRLIAKILFVSMIVHCSVGNFPHNLFAEDESNQVLSMSVESPGSVVITFSKPAEEVSVNAFTLEHPPKIVLDITDSELGMDQKTVDGPKGGIIKRLRSAQHSMQPKKVVRIVLDLKEMVAYSTKTSDSGIIVSLGDSGSAEKKESDTSLPSVPSSQDEMNEAYNNENETPSQEDVQADAKNDKMSIVDNLSDQAVTLDFNEAELADVFRILSAKSGVNIIFGDDVEGQLSIHLEQVPFREAFKTILSLKGLVAQQVGKNILRIITPEALTSQRSKSVTFWRVFPLNYADVAIAKAQIDGIRGSQGRRGNIEVDARTNSLIVADSPEGLDDVTRLIAEIDLKPQQVLIESRFVEVSLDKQMNIGVNWGYHSTNISGNKTTQIGTAKIERNVDTIGGTGTIITPSYETGVTAGIPGSVGSFFFGMGDDTSALVARIALLASQGKAKFLSNPKITTLNNQEARIWIGSQIPIRTTTLSENAATETVIYKQVGIELKVTPTINDDQRITLKVRPEVSLPDTANTSPSGDVPINTRYAETTVLIKNNETLVIGGFIEESKTDGVSKVPLLGDIPVLGQFFRSNLNRDSRRELLVFITPKILED